MALLAFIPIVLEAREGVACSCKFALLVQIIISLSESRTLVTISARESLTLRYLAFLLTIIPTGGDASGIISAILIRLRARFFLY